MPKSPRDLPQATHVLKSIGDIPLSRRDASRLLLAAAVGAAYGPAQAANPVQTENALAGTSAWRLTNPALNHELEGYASLTSVNRGSSIKFFVSTSDPSYTIDIYRMGWYAGTGARLVQSIAAQAGVLQTMPTPDATTGMIECNWTSPYTLATSASWISGVYLAKLTGTSSGKQSYIVFVVRDDSSTAALAFQSSVTTFQAYNNWGGKSLYGWNSGGDGYEARVVSFNRPYNVPWQTDTGAVQGVGAGEFLASFAPIDESPASGWEYNMVRFLEREGYDLTYITNLDTHEQGPLLLRHKGLLSVGHDEYWSLAMRNHVEAARNRGLNLGFFSANTAYWQVRFQADGNGQANRRMVGYRKNYLQDPLYADPEKKYLTTDRWRDPEANRPENALLGVMLSTDGANGDYTVRAASNWVFAGTGFSNGSVIAGLAGYEIDTIYANGVSPPGLVNLADVSLVNNYGDPGTANMVTYTAPSGATVFASGSIQWSWGLDDDYFSPALRTSRLSAGVQQMMRNILSKFSGSTGSMFFTDGFASTSMDATKWRAGTISTGAQTYSASVARSQASSQLTITPLANTSGQKYAGYVSAQVWDLTGCAACVQVVQPTSTTSSANTIFALSIDSANWYRVIQEGASVYFQKNVNGTKTSVSVAWSTQTAWWRIRHDASNDNIVWETSADGLNWTARRSELRELDVMGLNAELVAGTYGAVAAPGAAIFANFQWATHQWKAGVVTETTNAAVPVSLVAGGISISPLAGTAGQNYNGLGSTKTWNLGGGSACVNVTQTTNASSAANTGLSLAIDANNWYRIVYEAGNLYFQKKVSGSKSTVGSMAASAAWWRIRHDLPTDTVKWETSADGVTWTVRASTARQLDMTHLVAEVFAGTYQSETSPGTATFQNFNLLTSNP